MHLDKSNTSRKRAVASAMYLASANGAMFHSSLGHRPRESIAPRDRALKARVTLPRQSSRLAKAFGVASSPRDESVRLADTPGRVRSPEMYAPFAQCF